MNRLPTDSPLRAGSRVTGVRAVIARRMRQSLQQSAQLSFHATAHADPALSLCKQMTSRGLTVTVEDVLAWRLIQALQVFPSFNATLEENVLTEHSDVHLGCAMAAGAHLTVGVLRNAQMLSLARLAEARKQLVDKARSNTLKPSEMTGSTCTISNLGKGRTEAFTPILNPPQVALLGAGGIRKGVSVSADNQPVVSSLMGLSLTVDHQVLDGAPANEFLSVFCEALESDELNPLNVAFCSTN